MGLASEKFDNSLYIEICVSALLFDGMTPLPWAIDEKKTVVTCGNNLELIPELVKPTGATSFSN